MEPQILENEYEVTGIEINLIYDGLIDEPEHEGYYSSVEDAIEALKRIKIKE